MRSRNQSIIAVICIYALIFQTILSCVPEDDGAVKSFVAVSEGQQSAIRANKAKYPAYINFSDWLNGIQIGEKSKEEKPTSKNTNPLSDQGTDLKTHTVLSPKAFTPDKTANVMNELNFLAYIQKEKGKIDQLVQLIQKNDEPGVMSFLSQDVAEMQDIIAAILSVNEGQADYQPKTEDILAAAITKKIKEDRRFVVELFAGYLGMIPYDKTSYEDLAKQGAIYTETIQTLYKDKLQDEATRKELIERVSSYKTNLESFESLVKGESTETPQLVQPFLGTVLIVGGLVSLAAYWYTTSYRAGLTRISDSLMRSAINSITEDGLRNILNALISIGHRHVGSSGDARDYIIDRMESYGYTVTRETFSTPHGEGMNIIAERLGRKSPGKVLELGAHYDTVGPAKGGPTVGADDNGTGVTALLAIAQFISEHKIDQTLRFCFFDAEEIGILGSAHHAELVRGQIEGMLNVDMIGYASSEAGTQQMPELPISMPDFMMPDKGDFIIVAGNPSSGWLADRFEKMLDEFVPSLPYFAFNRIAHLFPGSERADHGPYWERGLNAVTVNDTAEFRNPNYHSGTDLEPTINYTFFKQVTQVTLATVYSWANPDDGTESSNEANEIVTIQSQSDSRGESSSGSTQKPQPNNSSDADTSNNNSNDVDTAPPTDTTNDTETTTHTPEWIKLDQSVETPLFGSDNYTISVFKTVSKIKIQSVRGETDVSKAEAKLADETVLDLTNLKGNIADKDVKEMDLGGDKSIDKLYFTASKESIFEKGKFDIYIYGY